MTETQFSHGAFLEVPGRDLRQAPMTGYDTVPVTGSSDLYKRKQQLQSIPIRALEWIQHCKQNYSLRDPDLMITCGKSSDRGHHVFVFL